MSKSPSYDFEELFHKWLLHYEKAGRVKNQPGDGIKIVAYIDN